MKNTDMEFIKGHHDEGLNRYRYASKDGRIKIIPFQGMDGVLWFVADNDLLRPEGPFHTLSEAKRVARRSPPLKFRFTGLTKFLLYLNDDDGFQRGRITIVARSFEQARRMVEIDGMTIDYASVADCFPETKLEAGLLERFFGSP